VNPGGAEVAVEGEDLADTEGLGERETGGLDEGELALVMPAEPRSACASSSSDTTATRTLGERSIASRRATA
jgi:hypothetical protein